MKHKLLFFIYFLFYISPHITRNNNNGNNIHFSFTNLFFLTYIPLYYPLTFQLISSPSGHHKFNFDHTLFFLKIKTHFMKGKKTNYTLNMAKFRRFIYLAESANRGDSLTSP